MKWILENNILFDLQSPIKGLPKAFAASAPAAFLWPFERQCLGGFSYGFLYC
jgi:hypothetical protein